MKIFIVSRGYPSDKYVTNGIFEFDQARALAKAGHQVVFLAVDLRSIRRKRKFGRESFEKDGVLVEAVNVPCGKIPQGLLRTVRKNSLKNLYKSCEKKYGKPDIIHSHFLEISYTTAQVLSEKNVPLVMTEHLSALNNKVIPQKLIDTGKNTYCFYDRLITVGDNLAKSLEKNFGVSSVTIPNVADTETFSLNLNSKKIAESSENEKALRIISVGSLIKRKNMNLLIKAFARLHSIKPDSYLDIYGKGVEKENLQELINKSGLTSFATLHGAKNRKEIAEKMAQADFFALASSVETFGVVYIEALSAGLPVVAAISGGPENFVDESNGILVEADNEDKFFEALLKMSESYRSYDRKAISENIAKTYSPSAVAEKLTALYKEISV